jgi:hypothetical protein
MADVERPQEPIDYDGQRNRRLARRGDRMQLTLARIELAMEGLIAVDRLLVLNQALTNVLHDASGGR